MAASGVGPSEFARRRGVSRQRLAYWRRRLEHGDGMAFVRVAIPGVGQPEAPASRAIEIVAGAIVVRVREDVDADRIARLVHALERRQEC
jgi:transposase-like protein